MTPWDLFLWAAAVSGSAVAVLFVIGFAGMTYDLWRKP